MIAHKIGRSRFISGLALVVTTTLLGGCGVGYYWQASMGHLELMRSRQPVAGIIDDPATPAEVRAFRASGADAVGMSTVPEATHAVTMIQPTIASKTQSALLLLDNSNFCMIILETRSQSRSKHGPEQQSFGYDAGK